jgi:RNA recognition motif-containing protein
MGSKTKPVNSSLSSLTTIAKNSSLSSLLVESCTLLEVSIGALTLTEPDVEKYFKQFGKVVDVAIMRDKNTGRSRGFAFVTFEVYSDDAAASLKQILLHPVSPHSI